MGAAASKLSSHIPHFLNSICEALYFIRVRRLEIFLSVYPFDFGHRLLATTYSRSLMHVVGHKIHFVKRRLSALLRDKFHLHRTDILADCLNQYKYPIFSPAEDIQKFNPHFSNQLISQHRVLRGSAFGCKESHLSRDYFRNI
jgi:hypothetical protein